MGSMPDWATLAADSGSPGLQLSPESRLAGRPDAAQRPHLALSGLSEKRCKRRFSSQRLSALGIRSPKVTANALRGPVGNSDACGHGAVPWTERV